MRTAQATQATVPPIVTDDELSQSGMHVLRNDEWVHLKQLDRYERCIREINAIFAGSGASHG